MWDQPEARVFQVLDNHRLGVLRRAAHYILSPLEEAYAANSRLRAVQPASLLVNNRALCTEDA